MIRGQWLKQRPLIYQMPMPAVVANKYLDVLAANPIARALSPGFEPGRNFLCWRLFDPAARDLYVDWEKATEVAISGLREARETISATLVCSH